MTVETVAAGRFERAWPSAAAADIGRNLDVPWFVYIVRHVFLLRRGAPVPEAPPLAALEALLPFAGCAVSGTATSPN